MNRPLIIPKKPFSIDEVEDAYKLTGVVPCAGRWLLWDKDKKHLLGDPISVLWLLRPLQNWIHHSPHEWAEEIYGTERTRGWVVGIDKMDIGEDGKQIKFISNSEFDEGLKFGRLCRTRVLGILF
jgi:hypothetical protein